ncbi:hypothetical protein Pelo_13156 [Pelomyxa schiedti]|nr:hypothetical protein Pelo_13156 [Pelomyxa schiedti]
MAGVPPEETAPTATPQQEPQGETTPTTAAQAAQFVTRQDVLDIFHQVEKEIIDLRGDFSRFVQADREIRRSDETQRNRDRQDWESALATLAAAQQQRDTRLENLLCTVSNRLDAIEAAQRSPPVCIAAPVPVGVWDAIKAKAQDTISSMCSSRWLQLFLDDGNRHCKLG